MRFVPLWRAGARRAQASSIRSARFPMQDTSIAHAGDPIFVRVVDLDRNRDGNVDRNRRRARRGARPPATPKCCACPRPAPTPACSSATSRPPRAWPARRLRAAGRAQRRARCHLRRSRPTTPTRRRPTRSWIRYGLVFDSQTGAPINGARVRLVDVATGLAATVFGDDGVSRYPSEMVTGQPVTDQGGTQYSMPAGVFRFPLVAPGNYRLEVLPPGSYAFPSQRTIADLQTLPNAPFRLQPGSFGQPFVVTAAPAVAVDVPLDPAGDSLLLRKSAGQQIATTGDFVQYTLTLQNTSEIGRVQRRAGGRPPAGRRALPRRARCASNGVRIADPVAGGRRHRASRTRSPASPRAQTIDAALRGRIHGRDARHEGRDQHRAGLRARQRALERSARAGAHERRAVLAEGLHRRPRVRRHLRSATAARTTASPNVRVYLEDGRYGVTDENGRFHFEGLEPGTHTVQLDKLTLPEYLELAPCADRMGHAGRDYSQFAELRAGTLVAQRFRAAPEGRAEGRRAVRIQFVAAAGSERRGPGRARGRRSRRTASPPATRARWSCCPTASNTCRAARRSTAPRSPTAKDQIVGAGEPVVSVDGRRGRSRASANSRPGTTRTLRFQTRSTPAAGGALTVRALAMFDSPAKSGPAHAAGRIAADARRRALRPLAVHVHAALRRAQDRAAAVRRSTRCAR